LPRRWSTSPQGLTLRLAGVAHQALDRLAVLTAPRAKVVRDGQVRDLAVRELVLGDVVEAAIGDQVVVDGRALVVAGLQVDESLLTGESDPIEKAPGDEVCRARSWWLARAATRPRGWAARPMRCAWRSRSAGSP